MKSDLSIEVDIIQFLPQMIVGGTVPLSLTSASFLTDTFDEILGGETWLWKHDERANFRSQGSCDCPKESHVRTPNIPKKCILYGNLHQ